MIGLDTNILVRYIVRDNKKQARTASDYLKKLTLENPGFISSMVLCELFWVLKSVYKYTRKQIAEIMEKIIFAEEFYIEDGDIAWRALSEYKNGADFADAMIVLTNKQHGVDETITFDRKAAKLEGFRLA